MPYVEFYKLQNDGTQKIVATCRLDGDQVRCEGEATFVSNLLTDGIKDYDRPNGERLFSKDGLKFLKQLKFNFTSGYLNASEVKDEEAVEVAK